MEIFKTKDYSIFNKIDCNRPVNNTVVKYLRLSIAKKNLLEQNPIVVNSNMMIIDGQHRLEAAKQLDIDIYYCIRNVDDTEAEEQMWLQNSTQRQWITQNFLDRFVIKGNPDYIYLKEFMSKYKMGITNSINLLGYQQKASRQSEKIWQEFREGKFKALNKEEANIVAKRVLDYIPFFEEKDSGWTTKTFVQSILGITRKGYDHDKMIRKFKTFNKVIHRLANVKYYYRFLEDVYNFQQPENTRINFTI